MAAATLAQPPAWQLQRVTVSPCMDLKWFASNANSGLALATARPQGAEPGSKGLGRYLVPSHLKDGTENHYCIRRLKDKLGTRGLPTGEIELMGAEAFEVAPPPFGFKLMMEAPEYS